MRQTGQQRAYPKNVAQLFLGDVLSEAPEWLRLHPLGGPLTCVRLVSRGPTQRM